MNKKPIALTRAYYIEMDLPKKYELVMEFGDESRVVIDLGGTDTNRTVSDKLLDAAIEAEK